MSNENSENFIDFGLTLFLFLMVLGLLLDIANYGFTGFNIVATTIIVVMTYNFGTIKFYLFSLDAKEDLTIKESHIIYNKIRYQMIDIHGYEFNDETKAANVLYEIKERCPHIK
jgi:hypothetical protein